MQRLADGTIIQSSLNILQDNKGVEVFFKDYGIKRGVITEVYPTDDPNNVSKKWVEYDVLVLDERADGCVSSMTYHRCQTLDRFGMPQNYERFTYNPPKSQDDKIYVKGAQVLVAALNGNPAYGKAIILGGIQHPESIAQPLKASDGTVYEFSFNGIDITIDKDGQYSLTFNSVLDYDGKPSNEKAAGTQIMIDKEGVLTISDNEKQVVKVDRVNKMIMVGTEENQIILDQKNKKIMIKSAGEMGVEAKDSISIKGEKDQKTEVQGSFNVKSQKDISLDAQSNLQMKAGANFQLQSSGNVQVKAGGTLKVEGGAIAQFKGGSITQIGEGTVPVAGVGISQCIGIGNQGAPVVSNIISGSATVFIGA